MFKFVTYRFKFKSLGFMGAEIGGLLDVDITSKTNHLKKAKEKAKKILVEQGIISENQKVEFSIVGKSEFSF